MAEQLAMQRLRAGRHLRNTNQPQTLDVELMFEQRLVPCCKDLGSNTMAENALEPVASDAVQRAWANAAIRTAIIEHAPTSALISLLRVNEDACRLAVGSLYRSIKNERALAIRLAEISNNVSPLSIHTASPLVTPCEIDLNRPASPGTPTRSAISPASTY